MATKKNPSQQEVQQLPDAPHAPTPSQSGASAAGGSGSVIEFDPNDPGGAAPARAQVAQAQASADTIVPSADLLQARDELERMLGGFSALASAQATATSDSTGKENIVGFAVGLRVTSGSPTGELAAKVFVREKLPEARLSSDAIIPKQVAGVPTDVEAIGEVLLHRYTERYPRPVPCGVSISNIDLRGSGTLGCLVVLNNNKLCLLSNNHVIANENAAQIGDRIIQPGQAEPVAAPDETIAVLENFVPIQATGNLVDAAVAWTSFSRVKADHVTYRVNPQPLAATIGMSVIKNGRTTQATMGVVTDIAVTIRVGYDPFPAGAEMRDQVAIRGVNGPFSKPGDSGSLIVTTNTKQPVALLFAGSNDNRVTFANPIAAVMSELGINRFV